MRLKLNKTLRAALIAAVSVVGFTITQAQATDLTEIATMSTLIQGATVVGSPSQSATWEIVSAGAKGSNVVYDFNGSSYLTGISDSTLMNALASVKTDSSAYVTIAAWINPTAHGGSIFSYGAQDDGAKLMDDGGSLKFTTKGRADFNGAKVSGIDLNPETWQLVAVTIHKSTTNGQVQIYDIVDNTRGSKGDNSDPNNPNPATFTIGNGNNDKVREGFSGSIGGLTVFTSSDWVTAEEVAGAMYAMPTKLKIAELVWNGTGEPAVWDTETANWLRGETPTTYVSGITTSASFGTNGDKAVSVSGDIVANGVTVQDDYSFTVADGNSLKAVTLTVETGKKATFAGAGSISMGAISGAIGINEGATVTLTDGVSLSGTQTLNVSGAGTLSMSTLELDGASLAVGYNLDITASGNETVKSKGGASSLVINGGTTTIAGGIHFTSGSGSKVEVGTADAEAKLVTGRLEIGDNSGGSSKLTIGQKGTLVITGTNDASGGTGQYKTTGLLLGEWGQGTATSVSGKLYAQNVKMYHGDQALNLTIENTGVVAVKGISKCDNAKDRASTITNNGGKLVLGEFGMTNNGGDWTITLNGGEIGMSAATTTLGRDMVLTGDVTFNTAQYTWSDGGQTLTQGVDGGTMTVSGNLTGTGSITKTGAGTLVLSGAANALSHTMNVQGGTLELSGTFAIDKITDGDQIVKTVDYEGNVSVNGFHMSTGTMKVYGTSGEGQVSLAGAHFTYQSDDVTAKVVDGVYTLEGTSDKSAVYVNDGTLAIAKYKEAAETAGVTIDRVELQNGTAVDMDAEITTTIKLADNASATVNTTAATTVSSLVGTSAGTTLTLGGSDVLTISGDNAAFASNVTIAGGTVKIGNQKSLGEHNSGASQAKTITIAAGGTLDLNGIGDANFTYTMAGGKLTNTDNPLGTNLSQTVGMTLTENSTVEALADKQFWLRARGNNATTLNLGGKTLVKTGAGMFGVYKSTVTAGTIEVQDGEFRFESGCSIAADIILKGGTISGETAVSDDIEITAAQASNIDNITLNIDSGKTVTLTADEILTFSHDLAIKAGTVEVVGTLDVKGSIDLSKNGASTGELSLKEGSETTAAGMWMASTASLLLEDGAVLNIGGLEIAGMEGGSIDTTAANEKYGTDKDVFSITNATVTSTGDNVTLGNTLSGVDVFVADGSSLTLNTAADSVTVNAGGTINKGESGSISNLTVKDGGTIGEGIDATEVGIAAESTATFAQGISDASGVTFSKEGGVDVKNTNAGGPAINYSINEASAQVTADKLTFTGEEDTAVANQVVVDEIVNATRYQLTLENAENLELKSMTIGEGSKVAVYTDETAAVEGTVTITESLVAGGGTLLADLTIIGNEAGTTTWVLDGTAMTLGSEFTLNTDTSLVNLDAATIAALESLSVGEHLQLINAAQDTDLTYDGDGYDGMWYGQLFTRTDAMEGDYKVYANGQGFGLTKVSAVPEPTTGTLSLLALMALAARRRRH